MMRFAARLVARRPLPGAARPAQRRLGSTDAHGHGHGHDHGHGHGHDGPNGYLFNVPPGHAAPKEGWELSYYVGMFGGFLLAAVGLAYKPDTNIQTWATKEAEERLKAANAKY